jgi:magnesium-transporting ATPase (P-type)
MSLFQKLARSLVREDHNDQIADDHINNQIIFTPKQYNLFNLFSHPLLLVLMLSLHQVHILHTLSYNCCIHDNLQDIFSHGIWVRIMIRGSFIHMMFL